MIKSRDVLAATIAIEESALSGSRDLFALVTLKSRHFYHDHDEHDKFTSSHNIMFTGEEINMQINAKHLHCHFAPFHRQCRI